MTSIVNLFDRHYIFCKTKEKLSEVCLTWARQNYLSWFNNVDNKVRIALRAPLLIRCPETKKFYVNYDPEIDKILREAKYFERIGQQFEHAKGTVQNAISKIIIFRPNEWPLTLTLPILNDCKTNTNFPKAPKIFCEERMKSKMPRPKWKCASRHSMRKLHEFQQSSSHSSKNTRGLFV